MTVFIGSVFVIRVVPPANRAKSAKSISVYKVSEFGRNSSGKEATTTWRCAGRSYF